MHVPITQTEMMTNLMHDDVRNQMIERFPVLAPFVEDRAAVKVDGRGWIAGLHGIADRAACIQAGQVERIVDAHLPQHTVVGEILDNQQHPGKMGGKGFRQALERRTG